MEKTGLTPNLNYLHQNRAAGGPTSDILPSCSSSSSSSPAQPGAAAAWPTMLSHLFESCPLLPRRPHFEEHDLPGPSKAQHDITPPPGVGVVSHEKHPDKNSRGYQVNSALRVPGEDTPPPLPTPPPTKVGVQCRAVPTTAGMYGGLEPGQATTPTTVPVPPPAAAPARRTSTRHSPRGCLGGGVGMSQAVKATLAEDPRRDASWLVPIVSWASSRHLQDDIWHQQAQTSGQYGWPGELVGRGRWLQSSFSHDTTKQNQKYASDFCCHRPGVVAHVCRRWACPRITLGITEFQGLAASQGARVASTSTLSSRLKVGKIKNRQIRHDTT